MSDTTRVAGLASGDVLADRYRLLHELGHGGMATVWLARDEALRRDVALKVFSLPSSGVEEAIRHRAETEVLASVSHPSLVTLYDALLEAQPPFLVLEHVDGEDLRSRLRRGPLAGLEADRVIGSIARALAHLHSRGIVHRDVTPSNILIPETGDAKLADLGVARLIDTARLTAVGTVIGTAAYLSPEQARGAEVGPPSDIYSLGLVYAEAVTGAVAFEGSGVEAAAARLSRDPDLSAPELDGRRELVAAMTDLEPTRRPTADEVAALLAAPPKTRVLPVSHSDATVPMTLAGTILPDPPRDPRIRGRRRTVAVAVALALVAGIVASLAGAAGIGLIADLTGTPAGVARQIVRTDLADTRAADDPPASDPGDSGNGGNGGGGNGGGGNSGSGGNGGGSDKGEGKKD